MRGEKRKCHRGVTRNKKRERTPVLLAPNVGLRKLFRTLKKANGSVQPVDLLFQNTALTTVQNGELSLPMKKTLVPELEPPQIMLYMIKVSAQ
jgi:hypothetical protein